MNAQNSAARKIIRKDAPEITSIERNPFAVIDATTRDDRKRIVELAEEKSFTGDHELCSKARADLTNPRNRLTAEISWLPGVSPKRGKELLVMLKENPQALRTRKDNISPIALANLIAAALELLDDELDNQEWASWILDLADTGDKIEPETLLRDINEDRTISNFPEIKGTDTIQSELNERQRAYKSAIKDALDRLPPLKLLDVVTRAVKDATSNGNKHAPALIDEMVDTYALHMQGFLRGEADKILKAVDAAEAATGKGKTAIKSHIKKIDQLVRHWEKFATPIQLSMKSRGLPHDLSIEIAVKIRGLSIKLVNEQQMFDLATDITNILKEVFAELPAMAEQVERDVQDLSNLSEEKEQLEKIAPIRNLCDSALEATAKDPKTGEWQGQRIINESTKMLADLRAQGGSKDVVSLAENYVARALFTCAIACGNSTEKWSVCVRYLEAAEKLTTETVWVDKIKTNLETARGNVKSNGGAGKVERAPTLFTFNTIGFTLYGNSDPDPRTGSHVATYYFVALMLPLIPVSRYRVIQNGRSFRFLGKEKFRTLDKWHLGVVLALIGLLFLCNQK